ncbi:MAG: hypothetical protein KUG82_14385 [Pseudomonadales bacterium]|nr:hypothetical protein [Pseudomonadales bacterium]
MKDDMCVIKLGSYKAHFSAYMPKLRGTQEFCESFPEIGEAIIAVDFVSRELRDQRIQFEVVKDFTGKGAKATGKDLFGEHLAEYTKAIIHQDVGSFRKSGTLNFPVNLEEKGWYIGVMRIISDDNSVIAESVFPFEVEPSTIWRYFVLLSFVVVLVGGLFVVVGYKK